MLGIAFLFAQRDHSDITARLWKGIRAAWNNGDRTGVAPYGYDAYFDVSDKGKRKLKINEAQAKVVKKVFQLYQEGYSFRKIAEVLNTEGVKTKNYGKALKVRFSQERKATTGVWTPSQIGSILRRPFYAGLTWNFDRTELLPANKVPAILDISRAEWRDMSNGISEIANRRNRNGINLSHHPLSALIRCSTCNAPYYYRHFKAGQQLAYNHHTDTPIEPRVNR